MTTPASTSYTLHLISLKCIKKQDILGRDNVLVTAGGRTTGPFAIRKGDDVPLELDRRFTGEIDITLTEVDGKVGGKNDDDLGTVTIDGEDKADAGEIPAIFNEKKGRVYHVIYEVLKLPGGSTGTSTGGS
jgi:hypothetical protein